MIFDLLDNFEASLVELKKLHEIENWLAMNKTDKRDKNLSEEEFTKFQELIKEAVDFPDHGDVLNEEKLKEKLKEYWLSEVSEALKTNEEKGKEENNYNVSWTDWIKTKLKFSEKELADLKGVAEGLSGSRIQQVYWSVLDILNEKMQETNPHFKSPEQIRTEGPGFDGVEWEPHANWIQDLENKIAEIKNKIGLTKRKEEIRKITNELHGNDFLSKRSWQITDTLNNATLKGNGDYKFREWLRNIEIYLEKQEQWLKELEGDTSQPFQSFFGYINNEEAVKPSLIKKAREEGEAFIKKINGKFAWIDAKFVLGSGGLPLIKKVDILKYRQTVGLNNVREAEKEGKKIKLEKWIETDLTPQEAVSAYKNGWSPNDLGFIITKWEEKEIKLAGKTEKVLVPTEKKRVVIIKREWVVENEVGDYERNILTVNLKEVNWKEAYEKGMDCQVFEEVDWTETKKAEFYRENSWNALRNDTEFNSNYFPRRTKMDTSKKKPDTITKRKELEGKRVNNKNDTEEKDRIKEGREIRKTQKLRDAYLASLAVEVEKDNSPELEKLRTDYLDRLGKVKLPETKPTPIIRTSEADCETLQEWLDLKYPSQEEKKGVEKISSEEIKSGGITDNQLAGGELDLTGFANLTSISLTEDFLSSPITSCDISKCPKLVHQAEKIAELEQEIRYLKEQFDLETIEEQRDKIDVKITEKKEELTVESEKIKINLDKNKIEQEKEYYRLGRILKDDQFLNDSEFKKKECIGWKRKFPHWWGG